ncbi:hypothetical protein DFJ77DRAFT_427258 [Powellomyces hirtus]|nr:hypothetical protein DFJ77DRAFT_427258 [Powellomyces hirtus]
MRTFVQNIRSDQSDSVALTPMPSAIRNLVAAMAKHYHVIPKTRGKGKHKITVLIRTQRSTVPRDWSRLVEKVVAEADGKLSGNTRSPQSFNKSYKERKAGKLPGPPNEDAKPKLGSIVGHGSAAIAETNVGHRMLKAMGWAPGQALGADGSGLINPVEVTIRGKRAGLGT